MTTETSLPATRDSGFSMLETLAFLLLALATVASAWSAYQASLWNSEQADQMRGATAARIESTKRAGLATQKIAYDAGMIGLYAQAYTERQTALQQFYRETLFRKEFLPVLDQWLSAASTSPSSVPNFFDNESYIRGLFAEANRLSAEADVLAAGAAHSNQIADDYVLCTVILATVLFFAGVSSKYQWGPLRLGLTSIAAMMFVFAIVRVVSLPVLR